MLEYTQTEALENLNHFETQAGISSLLVIAAGSLIALNVTSDKARKEALREVFDSTNSNSAYFRNAALRLAYYEGETLAAIANGETTLKSATRAISEHAKSFMRMGAKGNPCLWGDATTHRNKDALPLLALLPDDETKALLKFNIKQAIAQDKADINDFASTTPLAPNSEISEKSVKTAANLWKEVEALINRISAISDATSIHTQDTMAKFFIAVTSESVASATLSADLRLVKEQFNSAVLRLESKGEVTRAA